MSTVKASEVVRTGRCLLPRDCYVIRCIDARFAPSKKGKPMTTLTFEMLGKRDGTKQITVGDKQFDISGMKLNLYLLYTQDGVDDDGEPVNGQIHNVFTFNEKLEIDMPEIDPENPEHQVYKGKSLLVVIEGKQDMHKDAFGNFILDAEGKQIPGPIQNNIQIDNIIGPASADVVAAF